MKISVTGNYFISDIQQLIVMQKEFLIAVVDKKLGKPSYDKIHGAPWNNHDSLESAFKLIYE